MDSGWRSPHGQRVEATSWTPGGGQSIKLWNEGSQEQRRPYSAQTKKVKKKKKVNQKKKDVEAVVVQAEFRFQVDRSLGGGGAVCGWTRSKTEE